MPDEAKLEAMGVCATAWAVEFIAYLETDTPTVDEAREWFAAAIEAGRNTPVEF